MSRDLRKSRGREWDEYERLKGKLVRIYPSGVVKQNEAWMGILVWVDVYTIGVSFKQNEPTAVSIVYKDGIRIDPLEVD